MSAYYQNTAPTCTNDATFRVTIDNFVTGLTQVGLVKQTVAGEIDTATVAKPAAGSTIAGFQIWRLNDGLQGTAPFFMKVEYGTGNTATDFRLSISFGTAYDGSGNFTGSQIIPRQSLGSIGGSANLQPSYFSAGAGRFACCLFIGNSSGPTFFGFERTLDASGNPTTKGINFLFNVSSSTANFMVLTSATNAVPSAAGAVSGSIRNTNPTHWDGEIFLGAIFAQNGPQAYPLRNFLHARQNDFQNLQGVFTVNFYGTTAKYVFLGTGFSQSVSGSSAYMLMRWD